MKDLRFDWHPSLTSPQIEERLEVLLEELLKDYKSGSGIKPKSSFEASYRSVGKHLLPALYCAYHTGERVSLPRRAGAYGVGKTGRIQYSSRDARKVRETLLYKRWISLMKKAPKASTRWFLQVVT